MAEFGGGGKLAGEIARPMLRPVARAFPREIARAALAGGANPLSQQSRAISGPGAPSRLGTGALGRNFSRAWLQAQRLADAIPGRKSRTLVCAANPTACAPGTIAR